MRLVPAISTIAWALTALDVAAIAEAFPARNETATSIAPDAANQTINSLAATATDDIETLNNGRGRGRGRGRNRRPNNGNQNPGQNDNNNGNQGGGDGGNNGAGRRTLQTENVQDGSSKTGQVGEIAEGQVESLTDEANFINFCTGKTKTNGLQVRTGSCNGIVMGDIPATDKMVSTLIIFPNPEADIVEDTSFKISLRTDNLVAGHFTNAQATYYSAPQQLDRDTGRIVGHTHVTVQKIDDGSGRPPNAAAFDFFKGINNAPDNDGILSADVAGGLAPGKYRVCTMSSSSNHQPVLMPVAQRGAQDDCQRFTVRSRRRGNNNNRPGNNNNRPGRNDNSNDDNGRGNGGGNTRDPSNDNPGDVDGDNNNNGSNGNGNGNGNNNGNGRDGSRGNSRTDAGRPSSVQPSRGQPSKRPSKSRRPNRNGVKPQEVVATETSFPTLTPVKPTAPPLMTSTVVPEENEPTQTEAPVIETPPGPHLPDYPINGTTNGNTTIPVPVYYRI